LRTAIEKYQPHIYAGYNRPFAPAILKINEYIRNTGKPMTISYFISGHFIPADHWYRNKGEGTRICGNAGHWLDLTINLFKTRGIIPEKLSISISYANKQETDDNFSISLTPFLNDLVNFILNSSLDLFEGINETINIQCGEVIAKIDDFRRLYIWKNEEYYSTRYFPKDVGHSNAINQPWAKEKRDWNEIEISTMLMLHIKDMVEAGIENSEFSFK